MAGKTSNKKSLVIVESPAKAKTINKYLGAQFEVKASMGHVADLPSKGLNVDIENGFAPTYEVVSGRKRTVTELKASARNCESLYLATDLDREGEAIAWHLARVLGVPEERTFRVIFNAITAEAIRDAFAKPRKLDMDKVMAQQARRILDRIVGYQISPLLWKKVATGLSAGRVQSVAVKLVVERERQIRDFKPQEYWLIPAVFTADTDKDYTGQWFDFLKANTVDDREPTVAVRRRWLEEHNAFEAQLDRVGDEKFKASEGGQAECVRQALEGASFAVEEVKARLSVSNPPPPFITSTLQQAAANYLGMAAARTMRIAQQLYEGVEVGSMGAMGLITYMRTDSTHLAPEAVKEARGYINRNIGPEYLPGEQRSYIARKNAQQAHEAIRPTDVDMTPADIKPLVTVEQYKLYDLIWRRFVACQMASARWNVTTTIVIAQTSVGPCRFRANGRVLEFDGFSRIWQVPGTEQRLPPLSESQPVAAVDIKARQNFTKPPARYTEASLVKTLEKEGIGRPSTYASIISTIQDRDYVRQEQKKFYATDLGEVVTDKLCQYFPKIMDVAFTSHMEQQLDKIEERNLKWVAVLDEFYGPFKENLLAAQADMKHAKAETSPSPYQCPNCKSKMVYRFGKKGRFLSCSSYPECKFASPCDTEGKMIEEEVTEHKCPVCGKAMIRKTGRFGPFLGCGGYPECKTIMRIDKEGNINPPKPPAEATGLSCYKCKSGELVIRQSKRGPFLGCGRFPKCRTIVGMDKLEKLKALQAQGKWPPKTAEEAEELLGKKGAKKEAKK